MTDRRPGECVACFAGPDRPAKPRPADAAAHPRAPRCATHRRAERKRVSAAQHAATVVRVYGLADDEYQRLLELQGGTCAIPACRANGTRKRLAVDHDHETGEPRGLLCGPHNYSLLGRFAGDLHAAIEYLADPPARKLREKRSA